MGTEEPRIFLSGLLGQGKINQLGGAYINGRPLPIETRREIVRMHQNNTKPCEISRRLHVSHGAVSKILNRFERTGSIEPGQIGGNPRQRIATQSVEPHIVALLSRRPNSTPNDIRQHLIDQKLCTAATVPTVASLNRHLKSRGYGKSLKRAAAAAGSDDADSPPNKRPGSTASSAESSSSMAADDRKPKLRYGIDAILGIDSKSGNTEVNPSSPPSLIDEHSTSRSRTYFSPEQIEKLQAVYKTNPYPTAAMKSKISQLTGLSEGRVQVWFSNQRARCRKSIVNSGATFITPEQILQMANFAPQPAPPPAGFPLFPQMFPPMGFGQMFPPFGADPSQLHLLLSGFLPPPPPPPKDPF